MNYQIKTKYQCDEYIEVLNFPQEDMNPIDAPQKHKDIITVMSYSVKLEGDPIPAYFPTPEAAHVAYTETLNKFIAEHNLKKIIWRQRPIVEREIFGKGCSDPFNEAWFYYVYSRILVEDE